MDIETAVKILGVNRTKNRDLIPMVMALKILSSRNPKKDPQRLEAAQYVLDNWDEYKAYCNGQQNATKE